MQKPYVVVLAGGEGRRLAPLTRALYGSDVPKQFAVIAGERSLLQTTIERALVMTSAERIMVIVSAHQVELARPQLAAYPGVELIAQPANLDTGPGLLMPIARILAKSGTARVVFLPSDHHVPQPMPVADAIAQAGHGVLQNRLALIGVEPTGPEVEYGWIVRGAKLSRTGGFQVKRFCEKPSQAVAEELWQSGGLWNTFISTGPVEVFWDLARRHLPDHAEALERYALAVGTLDEERALQAAYATMTPANFSSGVLAHAKDLAVLPVKDSGWSDWGSPARVFASLEGTACHARLVERIRGELAVA